MALLCAIVAALTVVFTFSRGGLVAMASVVVVIGFVHRPSPRTVLVGLVLLVGLVAVLPSSYTDRLGQLTTAFDPAAGSAVRADPSVTGRSSELQAGLRMFVDHPVVGVGAGNYEARYQEYSREIGLDPRREDREAHNLFVEVAAETGLLGLAAFGALLVLAAQALFRSVRTSDRMGLAGALAAALTGYLVTAIFLHAAYSRTFWILLVLVFASAAQQLDRVVRPESAGRGHG
jgi:O-antigen ligase